VVVGLLDLLQDARDIPAQLLQNVVRLQGHYLADEGVIALFEQLLEERHVRHPQQVVLLDVEGRVHDLVLLEVEH